MYTHLAENSDPIHVEAGKGLIGACITSGEVLNISDAREDRRFDSSVDRRSGYITKEVLCVPLKDSSNQIIGGLQVINRSNSTDEQDIICPFTPHETGCLERMATQVQYGVQSILKTRREGKWKMHRFLKRWSNARLAKTWNNWYLYVKNEKRLKILSQRCLLLWQRRTSRMALNAWVDFWQTRTYKRTLLSRVLARMTKQRLHIGFRSWFRFWSVSNNSADAARQQVCAALDSCNSMLRLSSMEEACAVVRSAACQLLSASSATLYLVDRQRMLAWAYVANSTELHRVPFGHGIVGRMAQGGAGDGPASTSLIYNSAEEEDASVLCISLVDSTDDIVCVLDIRRPRWSPQEASLPFTEHDEIVAMTLGNAASALVERLQENDTVSEMRGQLQQAALAEEKMASIITWLFEVIGSGDSDEHRLEIEEMRETFIRAHYGSKTLGQLGTLTDEYFEEEDQMMNNDEFSNGGGGGGSSSTRGISYELNAGRQAQEQEQAPDWSRMFAEADLDHNGNLSPAEFKKFFETNFNGVKRS